MLNRFSPFVFYCILLFLMTMGDSIMSYLAPITINQVVHHPLYMGVIMSFSSVVGLACDTFFPLFFIHQPYHFFLKYAILLGLFFPITWLISSQSVPMLLLAMAIWGIYYELLSFSHYHSVHTLTSPQHHAFSWSLIGAFKSMALFMGPLLASYLYETSNETALLAALAFFLMALVGFTLLKHVAPARTFHAHFEPITPHHSRWVEWTIWWRYFQRLWLVYIFIVTLFLIDAAFLTVGVLLAEELQHVSPAGHWLIPAYMFPALLVSPVVLALANRFGKKRTAFVCGAVTGGWLAWAGVTAHPWWFVGSVFVSSTFGAIALATILGAMEDYISRVHHHREELVGLGSSAGSLAYIVGPVLWGGVAELVGIHHTFVVVGGLLVLVSVLALWKVPRKIKMPATQLSYE